MADMTQSSTPDKIEVTAQSEYQAFLDRLEPGFAGCDPFFIFDAAWRASLRSQADEVERLRDILATIQREAERENGNWRHLKRCIAVQARAALKGDNHDEG